MRAFILLFCLSFLTPPVFAQRSMYVQLGAGMSSAFNHIENSKEVAGIIKTIPMRSFTATAILGYQFAPRTSLGLSVSMQSYDRKIRIKDENGEMRKSDPGQKYTYYRRDGYNLVWSLQLNRQLWQGKGKAIHVTASIGAYQTNSLIDISGRFVPGSNGGGKYSTSHDVPPKPPYFEVIPGKDFVYSFDWNFTSGLGLIYYVELGKSTCGIFLEGSTSMQKNYYFNVYYYHPEKDGVARISNQGTMLRLGLLYRLNEIDKKIRKKG